MLAILSPLLWERVRVKGDVLTLKPPSQFPLKIIDCFDIRI
jgi:hypothetical protein